MCVLIPLRYELGSVRGFKFNCRARLFVGRWRGRNVWRESKGWGNAEGVFAGAHVLWGRPHFGGTVVPATRGSGAVSATEEGAHAGRSRCALGHCVGKERPSLSRGVAMRGLVGVNGGMVRCAAR